MTTNTPGTLRALKVVLAALGVGAIPAGIMFIIAPDGRLLGIPTSALARSPFTSYLIPGILLLVINGICPFINIYALTRRPTWPLLDWLGEPFGRHWSFTTSTLQGIALVVWVSYEMYVFGLHWLMITYGLVGVAIILLTLARATRNALASPRTRTRTAQPA